MSADHFVHILRSIWYLVYVYKQTVAYDNVITFTLYQVAHLPEIKPVATKQKTGY